MGEYKLGDPSLHFMTSRSRKTVRPLRRSTRSKKSPERFSSTQVQMEKITRTETEEDNQSSAKIKLVRKMGKWMMHNEQGGNKSKRFKSNRNGEGNNTNNRHGEGRSNKSKGTGHAGAQSERKLNNNSVENKKGKNSNSEVNVNLKNIDDEFNNTLCEQVPFSILVPPVPAEETVCLDMRQPSPETVAPYLDHDYAIPRTKGVRFKGHQNSQSATKELQPQNEEEVEIIGQIPAEVLKINETEMKEEIEDLADTCNPQSATKELEPQNEEVEIIREIPGGVLNINETRMKEEIEDLGETCIPQSATEELEPQKDDEVQIIGEILTGVLKMNETQMKEDIEDLAEACTPQSATQEPEPQNVDEASIFGEIPAGLQKIDDTQKKDEASISSVTNEELSTMKSMNQHDNVVQNIKGGCYLNEVTGRFQNIVKEDSEPENKDEVQTVGETDKSSTVQNVINTEIIQEIDYPDEIVKSEGSLGEDEAGYRRQGVDEVVNGTVNTASGHMVRGVGPASGHMVHGVGPGESRSSQVGEHRQYGEDEVVEQRRHGEDEEQRRHGVGEVGEQRRHGVGEVGERRREVGDMGYCGACRRNDKIKIKMEIEMSTEQFLQVAKELPNIVTTANVHPS